MENKKSEEFAKSILSNSKLDIENPDFNTAVMNKISRESRKSTLFYNYKYYALFFIGIDILIITLLRLFNIRFFDITNSISNISIESMSGQIIPIYFTLLVGAILFIKLLSGNGYLHSRSS